MCFKITSSPEDYSFCKNKTHHAIFNLVLQRNLDYMIIKYALHTCFQPNVPSLSLPTPDLSSGTKCSYKFWGSMYQQISTKFLLKNMFYHNKHQAQWLLPAQGVLLPQYMITSLDVWLFSNSVFFFNAAAFICGWAKLYPHTVMLKGKKKGLCYYVNAC